MTTPSEPSEPVRFATHESKVAVNIHISTTDATTVRDVITNELVLQKLNRELPGKPDGVIFSNETGSSLADYYNILCNGRILNEKLDQTFSQIKFDDTFMLVRKKRPPVAD